MYSSELCEFPRPSDGEGAVGVELCLVYETGVAGSAWMDISRDGGGWGAHTGEDDEAQLFLLPFLVSLPYLDVGNVVLEYVRVGVAPVEDGGDDAPPGAIVLGHGELKHGYVALS